MCDKGGCVSSRPLHFIPCKIIPWIRTDHFGISFICPKSGTYLCTPGNVMPQIPDILMHTGQWYALDFRQTSAHRAVIYPRFLADLCTPGIDMSQIWDILMHTGQWYVPDLRQTYAHRAMIYPRFQADLCTPEAICMIFQTDFSTFGAIWYIITHTIGKQKWIVQ